MQLDDALVNVSAVTSEQVEDVGAGDLATVPVPDNLPDFAKAQAECLARPDEPQPLDHVGFIVAVLRFRSPWFVENPNLLVVADRLDCNPGTVGDLPNAHVLILPLDSPPRWRVYHRSGGAPVALTLLVSSETSNEETHLLEDTDTSALLREPPDDVLAIRRVAFSALRHEERLDHRAVIPSRRARRPRRHAALRWLHDAGLVERDTAGRVVGIAGLTLEPTKHRLVLDGQGLYTWCAIDAVGIPAALSLDAQVTTSCAHRGATLSVRIITVNHLRTLSSGAGYRRPTATTSEPTCVPLPTSSAR